MAYVTHIFIHSDDIAEGQFTAHVQMKPAGGVQVKFRMDKGFHDCILKAAQNAADLHEQQMRAEILATPTAQAKDGE